MNPPTPPTAWEARTDLLVVGGGVAGLTAARTAAASGAQVLMAVKDPAAGTATSFAQGGIAAVDPQWQEPGDSVAAHTADTLAAGADHGDPVATTQILAAGGAAVRRLRALGARFDTGADGTVALAREGGHRYRRILRAGGDATGAEIQRTLLAAAAADSARITARIGWTVLRVLTGPDGVTGALVAGPGGLGVVHTPAVVLATGGFGRIHPVTTNPAGATGDGLALALDAGAELADIEFVQFHPTALYTAGATGRTPLVSEAVRGEGARLIDVRGRAVTAAVPDGDLAPRDVVARAAARAITQTDAQHVWLDARSVPDFAARFPTITASCRAIGVDPAADPIPVAPAAHYGCGGVRADTAGRTGVPGLLAVGEIARTGLHGANRLASNSLLEALVVGERAGAVAAGRRALGTEATEAEPMRAPVAGAETVRAAIGAAAGVVRTGTGLAAAEDALAGAAREISVTDRAGIEAAGLTVAARAVLAAAGMRCESRGCHHRADAPEPAVQWAHRTVLVRRGDGGAPTVTIADRGGRAPAHPRTTDLVGETR